MAVEHMLNISLIERFDSTNSNTMKIIEPILKISSTDPFVHLYGQEIFRTFLNSRALKLQFETSHNKNILFT